MLITLQDVASAAGVHRSTVTLALRDVTRISAKQRARIQDLARQMGYKANPVVTAMMKSRRSGLSDSPVPIAYIDFRSTEKTPEYDQLDAYFEGAQNRSKQLGWPLRSYLYSAERNETKSFSAFTDEHRVGGVILGPKDPIKHIGAFWGNLPSVGVGDSWNGLGTHTVREDHYGSAERATRTLIRIGYRRIGLLLDQLSSSSLADQRRAGAFLAQQSYREVCDAIPVLNMRSSATETKELKVWLQRWKPDAVLVNTSLVLKRLRAVGLSIPGETGVAVLNAEQKDEVISGIVTDREGLGSLAFDNVIGAVLRGDQGSPTSPHEVLLPGSWRSGVTTTPCSEHAVTSSE